VSQVRSEIKYFHQVGMEEMECLMGNAFSRKYDRPEPISKFHRCLLSAICPEPAPKATRYKNFTTCATFQARNQAAQLQSSLVKFDEGWKGAYCPIGKENAVCRRHFCSFVAQHQNIQKGD